jgi:hypothetical protein
MKWKMILVGTAVIASIMAISTHSGVAFADPQHCDRPGWPDCFDVGKAAAIPGTECPSGHSKNYCRGWEAASGSSLRDGSNDNDGGGRSFGNDGQSHSSLVDKVCNFAQTNRVLAAGAAMLLGYPGLDAAVRALCEVR